MNARARIGCCCLLLALVQPALAAEVYRWVDAAGEVHYSATPPPAGQQAEQMDVRVAPPATPPAAAPRAAGEAAPETSDKAADKARQQREYEAHQREQCANARAIVERLESRPATMFMREDGSYQRYTDEERARRIEEARAFERQYCN